MSSPINEKAPQDSPMAMTSSQLEVYFALHDYAQLHYGGGASEGSAGL